MSLCPQIIYYEHAQHQHHYDHEEEESHGWGPWSRSILPDDVSIPPHHLLDSVSAWDGQKRPYVFFFEWALALEHARWKKMKRASPDTCFILLWRLMRQVVPHMTNWRNYQWANFTGQPIFCLHLDIYNCSKCQARLTYKFIVYGDR